MLRGLSWFALGPISFEKLTIFYQENVSLGGLAQYQPDIKETVKE